MLSPCSFGSGVRINLDLMGSTLPRATDTVRASTSLGCHAPDSHRRALCRPSKIN